jgi:DNA-binding XRE family transcriptional regulator
MTGTEYKALREQLDLNQGELASRLGVSRKTINSRENGARITEEAALALAMLLEQGRNDLRAELNRANG